MQYAACIYHSDGASLRYYRTQREEDKNMVGGGSAKLKRWRVSQGHLRTRRLKANGVTRWRVQEQDVAMCNTYRYSGELGLKGGLALVLSVG